MAETEREEEPVERIEEATEEATEEITETADNALDAINSSLLELRGLVDGVAGSIQPLTERIAALEGKTEEVTAEPVEEAIHEINPVKKHWAEKLPKWL